MSVGEKPCAPIIPSSIIKVSGSACPRQTIRISEGGMNPKTSKCTFLLGLLPLLLVSGAAAQGPSPDFSGSWVSTNATGLKSPPAGPGPIADLEGYSHFG